MIRHSLLPLAALTVCVYACAQNARPGQELLANADLSRAAPGGERPDGWEWGAGAQWANEAGKRWIVEDAKTPTSISVGQRVAIGPRYWKLRVSCRVRTTDVKLGPEGWNNARLAMQFQDDAGKMVGAWPEVLSFVGSTDGWESQRRDYIVPEGAKWLAMSCSIFAATGKVEWADVSIKLLKLTPIAEDATLPDGVTARWDYESAQKLETPQRNRVCINGLWRFHPVSLKDRALPAAGTGWGYYKVPGSWAPGTARMNPIGPDIWETSLDLNTVDAAWYQREITIPASWAGRRILVNLDNPKHIVRVFVDGQEAGKVEWPGGRADITALATPGKHTLSVHIVALPLEESQILVAREDLIQKVRSEVRFKGLCGDCFLESEPPVARVEDVFLKPSVRRGGLGIACEMAGLDPSRKYRLRANILEGKEDAAGGKRLAKQITSPEFPGQDRLEFFGDWKTAKLWDLDQPNLYSASVELLDGGRALDATLPVTFGFREFWISGRDFMLNGTPIHLRCLNYGNAGEDFGSAAYAQARETFRRARTVGFNYVIHSNYDYEPQSFTNMSDTLRAGDDAGFPMSYSIRHIARIGAEFDNPEKRRDWERVVSYEVKQVRNHPSVFMWAMDHNLLGWADDQNPARITGKYEPAPGDDPGLDRRRHAGTLAEQIVMGLDGTRPAYHHQSGPFNQMVNLNCYLNFTPLQDRIEWLSRWSGEGIKPLFFVEFGLPHQASWTGHRTGEFIWGNKVSPEPLVQEFGAMYYGDAAYDIPRYAEDHYDDIARVYANKEPFGIWDVLSVYWDRKWEKNFLELKTLHTLQTWPAFRTWGISAILPWDQADLFGYAPGARQKRTELKTDWANLQQPGLSPDYLDANGDWLMNTTPCEPTLLGKAFLKLNRETLAYIAGPERRFTARDHVFRPGEVVAKQLIFINDQRRETEFAYSWSATVGGRTVGRGSGTVSVPAGRETRIPIQFAAPAAGADASGRIELAATVGGKSADGLQDAFDFTVLAPTPKPASAPGIAVYDPKGLTIPVLKAAGLRFDTLTSPLPPPGCKLLIIGREAMTMSGPGLYAADLMSRGTTVLIFEQTEDVLQLRWGFRTASPGTRRVFVRQPGHPVCRAITDDLLRDWRGSSSLVTANPEPVGFHANYPEQVWCGFTNTRTWKWGNYGTVASVVMEKPQRGNFSAILDCEFDQQYTPLLEWEARAGRTIFCQVDFSGRDMADPAAARLLANLLSYAQSGGAAPLTGCTVVGPPEAKGLITSLGADAPGGGIAVIAPGADPAQAQAAVAAARTVVCIGLDGKALSAVLPFPVATETKPVEHTLIGRPLTGALVGLGNADFHWRAHISVPVITQAPPELSVGPNGILAEGAVGGKRFVLMQSWPGDFDWREMPQLKRTWRHSLATLSRVLTNCGVALSSAADQRLASGPPVALNLAGPWRFTTDPTGEMQADTVAAMNFDASGWRTLQAPATWESQVKELENYDGFAWYRKEFTVMGPLPAGDLTLSLGVVDDEDWTYLNGKLVGHIGQETNPDNYWSAPRRYRITREMLLPGRNVVAVRVNDLRQTGGIVAGPLGIYEPGRWLNAHYLDTPDSLDDPYRYNRW